MKIETIPPELKMLGPEMKTLNLRLETYANDKEGFLKELLQYVLIGSGKRIRPCLVHLTSSLGRSHLEEVRRVALAVEFIHIATLIHDDVIDHAVLRRSLATVGAKFGDENAVLLGDYVYAEAFRELAHLGRPELVKLLADTSSIICQGEIRQIQNRFEIDLPENEYFSFIDKKTASLFKASCEAGGLLGGLETRQVENLGRLGRHLGMAFQITDDLLDLVGEENRMGKTLRTDLIYGKLTLPLIHLRDQKKSPAEQARFVDLVKNPNGHPSEIVEWMVRSGAVESAQKVARQHVEAALRAIATLPEGREREGLWSIAQTLLDRET
jgi:geranylgeranyl pyrophosphate synthase